MFDRHQFHGKVALSLDDAVDLVQTILTQPDVGVEVAEAAIKCSQVKYRSELLDYRIISLRQYVTIFPCSHTNRVQSWVVYARRAYLNNGFHPGLDKLRSIIPLMIQNLAVEALFEVTAEFFTDVLVTFPAFFYPKHFASLAIVLTNASAQEFLLALKAGDPGEDALDFSRLLFAYGDAAVQDLARNADDAAQAQVLHQLVQLVNCAGYDEIEIQVCSQAIEFWGTFTEHAIDELFTEKEVPIWMDTAKRYLVNALENGWLKIRFPCFNLATWNSQARTEFKDLRRDFQDLVQASFTLLGLPIFETFANLTLDALDRRAWFDVEAALHCLNALSDSTAADPATDGFMSRIFSSQLFTVSVNATAQLPVQTQQTGLDALTNYTPFFERQYKYLPDTLSYLFQSLESPNLAHVAAKAISSICSSCSKQLVSEINNFLRAYEGLQQKDVVVKERIIAAISMVISEIPRNELQAGPLSELLNGIERDAAASGMVIANGLAEEALATGLCALRCLASMGKALQSSDEAVIDLDDDSAIQKPHPAIWAMPAGLELQSRVVRLLQAMTSSLNFDSSIIEAVCLVLRTGYKENEPGLFVLPPSVTIDLVDFGFKSGFGSPRLTYLLDAASSMLSMRHYASPNAMNIASSKLLLLVLVYVQTRNSKL